MCFDLAQQAVDLLEDGLHSHKPLEEVIDPVADHFANPEHLERSLGLDREALRVRLRNHFRDTFLRLLKGA